MTDREKKLVAVIAAMALAWGGWKGIGWRQAALEERRDAQTTAADSLSLARTELLISEKAKLNLDKWRTQSLPKDRQVAKSDYRAWLMDQLHDAGLVNFNKVQANRERQIEGAYNSIAYTAHAEGSLEQITRFLHRFYASPQLQKLTRLDISPKLRGSDLSMTIDVEALIVEGTERSEGLPEGTSDNLALADVDAYIDSIKGRNLFIPYKAPPPPRPQVQEKPKDPPQVVVEKPKDPPFDHAKHAKVSGIVGNGDRYQAWITVQTTGERIHVNEGDTIEIGEFAAQVKSIDVRSLVVELDGELHSIALGDDLRSGKPVPAT